ncbi:MAG: hypothetical protein R3263_11060, partial [Myxococcota bacterium]|nr:hypothetical protein [Myxococcota bacterium]
MERAALLDALVELAREAGITVRRLGGGPGEGGPAARSGSCRIRGRPWLLLAPADPLEDRIDAAAGALAGLGEAWREARFLPPAVREAVERAAAEPASSPP